MMTIFTITISVVVAVISYYIGNRIFNTFNRDSFEQVASTVFGFFILILFGILGLIIYGIYLAA
jgi:hypothetical protein